MRLKSETVNMPATTKNKMPSDEAQGQASLAAASGSVDSYAWWVGAIMVLMACLLACVVRGQGMSAIAFAIVIHTAAKIQRWESK